MSPAEKLVLRHLVIRGRVQAVGFRAWTEYSALKRGLEGYVRNRRDGTVEAVLAGPADAVDAMIEACRQGPPGARVDAVDIREGDTGMLRARHAGERFSVLATV